MNIERRESSRFSAAAIALALTFVTASAHAQTNDTRLGKLSFENGFPSEETTRRVFDEMDYQRAVEAGLFDGTWKLPDIEPI